MPAPSRTARAGEAPLDAWTLPHAAAGAALGAVARLRWVTVALVGFEVVEACLRRMGSRGKGLLEHESKSNIAADVLVAWGMAVAVQAARWAWRARRAQRVDRRAREAVM